MAVKELFAQLHEVAAAPKKQLEKYLAEECKREQQLQPFCPQPDIFPAAFSELRQPHEAAQIIPLLP